MVAVGAFGQGSDVGVGGFGSRVRHAVLVERVPDQLLEPFDGAGQRDELVESGAACPGDPAGEEFFSSAAFGGEDCPELFLEQVRPVQRELVVLILARLSCWSSVRSAGFFTTAQRALRSRSPACSRVRRRTRSRAFVPHITTWNGLSRRRDKEDSLERNHRIACGGGFLVS